MDVAQIKHVEIDGLPAVGQTVLVDCGTFRCLGRTTPEGKLVDNYSGEELKNIVGYYIFG